MRKLKAYFVQGKAFLEFDVLQEGISKTGEPCYLAVVKGTEQKAWLFRDVLEFWTSNGNIVIPIDPRLGELVITSVI